MVLEAVSDLVERLQAEKVVKVVGWHTVVSCAVLQALTFNTFGLKVEKISRTCVKIQIVTLQHSV